MRWGVFVLCAGCRSLLGFDDLAPPCPPEQGSCDVDLDSQPPGDANVCFTTSVGTVCVPPPQGALTIKDTIDTTIDLRCATTTFELCVIAAGTITVGDVRVVGLRPLMLLAVDAIEVTGTLDVASHRLDSSRGAGANSLLCMSTVMNGSSAGSAGGSFQGTGGIGGANQGAGVPGGTPAPAVSFPSALRGGCRGGHSGLSSNDSSGGGAVAIASHTLIRISGAIDASGQAGDGGATKQGGAGGGSGGMIVIDAPMVEVLSSAVLLAAGGGGGAGGDNASGGAPGTEPQTAPVTFGFGGAASGAGSGGGGSTQQVDGGAGAATLQSNDGGGGGGGGGGYIQLRSPMLALDQSATLAPFPLIDTN